MTAEIIITAHAYDMARERLSLERSALKRLADRAFHLGICHSQTKGDLKRYIKNKTLNGGSTANNIRVYGEVIYFFCDFCLVTVYQMPGKLRKQSKRKISVV